LTEIVGTLVGLKCTTLPKALDMPFSLRSLLSECGLYIKITLVVHYSDMRVRPEMAPWGLTSLGVGIGPDLRFQMG
jgi:hypothetical protein